MKTRRSHRPHIMWLLLVLAAGGCQYLKAPIGLVPVALPPEAVDHVGVWAFKTWVKTVKTSRNAEDQRLVAAVAQPIIDAARSTQYARVAEQFRWEVCLVEDDMANAYAFPGGKVAVNTGLLKFTKRSKDWLAVALAHEVVHALARHAGERMNAELKQGLALALTGEGLSKQGLSPAATAGVLAAIGVSWEGSVMIPFSRAHESAADVDGLLLMARAGYDPRAAVAFWTEMKKRATGSRVPAFLSAHPSEEQRISDLERRTPDALKLFYAATGAKG
jgi:metalloendopeptidase OMA1, mitochondrial